MTEMPSLPPVPPGAEHPQLRRLQRFALIVLVVAILLGAWGIYERARARSELRALAQQTAIPVVGTVRPRRDTLASELILPGNVQAHVDAPIYARTSGYLRHWYADIGQHVQAGQLLAEIDAPEIDQQLRQAEADLAQAETIHRIAEVTAARWQQLRSSDSVSQQDADDRISQAESSSAQVLSARANVQRLRELVGFERVVAPFGGVVTARDVDIGTLITQGATTGQELFHLTDTRRVRVYVQVPESYATAIAPGEPATLELTEHPGIRFAATIARTAAAINAATRTLLVELQADNPRGELLPGAYAQVHIPLSHAAATWRLPADALLYRADGLHVATVDGRGRIRLNAVRLGRDFGSELEILAGLDAQDRVVVNPPDSIQDGMQVRVQDASVPPASGAPPGPLAPAAPARASNGS